MKKIFLYDSDNQVSLGKNCRRMMMNLSITVDEDLQQTLSFFEKVFWLYNNCPSFFHGVFEEFQSYHNVD